MSSSEWISIALSLVGFSFAFWVSWVFYRAQQQTDFRSLVEKLSELKTDLVRIHETADKYQKINEYGTHQSMLGVDKLNNALSQHSVKLLDINSTVSGFQKKIEIVSKKVDAANFEGLLTSLDSLRETTNRELHSFSIDIKQHTLRDLTNVEREIKAGIEKSSKEIVDTLTNDISRLVTNAAERDSLVKHIAEVMKELSLSMTSKQSSTFEALANALSANLNLRESATRNSVTEGVSEIQRTVRNTANQLAPYQSTQESSTRNVGSANN